MALKWTMRLAKAVLIAYQKRKDEEIFHPFLKEKGDSRIAAARSSKAARPLASR